MLHSSLSIVLCLHFLSTMEEKDKNLVQFMHLTTPMYLGQVKDEQDNFLTGDKNVNGKQTHDIYCLDWVVLILLPAWDQERVKNVM